MKSLYPLPSSFSGDEETTVPVYISLLTVLDLIQVSAMLFTPDIAASSMLLNCATNKKLILGKYKEMRVFFRRYIFFPNILVTTNLPLKVNKLVNMEFESRFYVYNIMSLSIELSSRIYSYILFILQNKSPYSDLKKITFH